MDKEITGLALKYLESEYFSGTNKPKKGMPDELIPAFKDFMKQRGEDNQYMVDKIAEAKPGASIIPVGAWHLIDKGNMQELLEKKPGFAGKTGTMLPNINNIEKPGLAANADNQYGLKVDHVYNINSYWEVLKQSLGVSTYSLEGGIKYLSLESAKKDAEKLNNILPDIIKFKAVESEHFIGKTREVKYLVTLEPEKRDVINSALKYHEIKASIKGKSQEFKEVLKGVDNDSKDRMEELTKFLSKTTTASWKLEKEGDRYQISLKCKNEDEAFKIMDDLKKTLKIDDLSDRIFEYKDSKIVTGSGFYGLSDREIKSHFGANEKGLRAAIPERMHVEYNRENKDTGPKNGPGVKPEGRGI